MPKKMILMTCLRYSVNQTMMGWDLQAVNEGAESFGNDMAGVDRFTSRDGNVFRTTNSECSTHCGAMM